MKLKNAVIGQVVQIKDIHEPPTEGDARICYRYGVTVEEHEGVIVSEPDEDGDVKVEFSDGSNDIGHHSNLKRIKEKHS